MMGHLVLNHQLQGAKHYATSVVDYFPLAACLSVFYSSHHKRQHC